MRSIIPPMPRVPKYIGRAAFLDVPAYTLADAGKAQTVNPTGDGYVYTAFEAAGAASAAVATHVGLADPHSQYELESANTAAAILTKLLTVDGSGSGLDADLLDGLSSAAFAAASHAHAGEDITSGTVADARIAASLSGKTLITPTIASFVNAQHTHADAAGGGTISGGGGTPGGSDTYVQFNDGSAFGGVAGFNFVKATNVLSVTGRVVTPKWSPAADSTTALQVTKADGTTVIQEIDTVNQQATFRRNSAGPTVRALNPAAGGYGFYTEALLYSNYAFQASGTAYYVKLAGAGAKGFVLEAHASQTANLLEFGSSLGLSDLHVIAADGKTGIRVSPPTALLHLAASTSARAQFNLTPGTDPSVPNNGDVTFDGTNIKIRVAGAWKTFTLT